MSTQLVSVVIPCYNQARFLGEAVESVLAQTYRQFEIVVVDDGSTDETSEVAARYPQVRCIRQENRGLSGARNRGLQESRGDYLVFLDSDDRLLPNALEAGLRHLGEHPECAFTSGRYRLIDSEGSPVPTNPQPHFLKDHYFEFLQNNIITVPASVMYRREVFEEVGDFDTSLRACEDYDFYLRAVRRFGLFCHDEVVVEYRRHGANMTGDPVRMLRSVLRVHGSQLPYAKADRRLMRAFRKGDRYWRYRYGDGVVGDVRLRVREGQWGKAAAGLLFVLRHYPRGFFKHAARKLYCVLFRVQGRPLPEAAGPGEETAGQRG